MATVLAMPPSVLADSVIWTNWSSATPNTAGKANGSATGKMGDITVIYSGQTDGLGIEYAKTVGSAQAQVILAQLVLSQRIIAPPGTPAAVLSQARHCPRAMTLWPTRAV